jgi:hypothetical protein
MLGSGTYTSSTRRCAAAAQHARQERCSSASRKGGQAQCSRAAQTPFQPIVHVSS